MALLLFGVLIFVHELGHYIAARVCHVRVFEFAIGMGPKIIKWVSKKSGIKYSVRLFPIGGFCAMEGESEYDNPRKNSKTQKENEDDSEQSTEADNEPESKPELNSEPAYELQKDSDSLLKKPAWIKIIILCAGPLMNIVLGFLLTFVMVISSRSDGEIVLASNHVAKFTDYAISDDTGLCSGDEIIKVGNVAIHTGQELVYEIAIQGKKIESYQQYIGGDILIDRQTVSLNLTVIRNGEKLLLEDVRFLAEETDGTVFGNVDFSPYREKTTFGNIIKQTWFRSLSSVKMVWDSLIGMITGRFSLSSVSGPVGATQVITEAARSGWYMLLYIFIVISMNLGVFNLLPFLPLDGGHIVFALYELIFRKPAPKKVKEICQIAGVLLLFGLMIIVTIKDIVNLF